MDLSYITFGGSYVSAWLMGSRRRDPLSLPPNDLDVFVGCSGRSDEEIEAIMRREGVLNDGSRVEGDIVGNWYEFLEEGGLRNLLLNIVILRELNPVKMIERFDINAIRVGVTIVRMGKNLLWPVWHDGDEAFQSFFEAREPILRTPHFPDVFEPAGTLIRLLVKSQELKLAYELPRVEVLHDVLDGALLKGSSARKYERLCENGGPQAEVLNSLFKIVREGRRGHYRMWIRRRCKAKEGIVCNRRDCISQ